jgi:hypothetical protein
LLVALGFLSGCSSTSRDVTSDARYAGGYQAGQTYRLTDNASLIVAAADHWQTGARYYLTRPACADSIPNERPDDKPIASLPPGARLRITRLVAFHTSPTSFYWHDLIHPLATMLDGPYGGTEVDITEISHHTFENGLTAITAEPSPDCLELVGNQGGGQSR